MLLQRCFAGVVIFGVEIAFIGDQRHFGVDHHIFSLRQPHDDIRLHPRAGVIFDADLGFIFIPFTQTGSLQHPRQYYLAPVALGFIVAFQRARQVDRFLGHLRVELLEIANFVGQGMAFLCFFTKAVLNLTAETVQLFT